MQDPTIIGFTKRGQAVYEVRGAEDQPPAPAAEGGDKGPVCPKCKASGQKGEYCSACGAKMPEAAKQDPPAPPKKVAEAFAEPMVDTTVAGWELVESAGVPKGSTWDVVVIESGMSKNGRLYTEKALRESAQLFEGVRVLDRSDESHLANREKSTGRIVGWLTEARYTNGAVVAKLNLSEAASELRTKLVDAWQRGKKDLVGLSLVAEGRGEEVVQGGRRVAVVEALSKVSFVDVVVEPAAGGKLLRLVAAEGGTGMNPLEKLIALLTEATDDEFAEHVKGLKDDLVVRLAEADADLGKRLEGAGRAIKAVEATAEEKAAAEKAAALKAIDDDAAAKRAALESGTAPVAEAAKDKLSGAIGQIVLREALGETSLPELVQEKVKSTFADKEFTEAEMGDAIRSEVELWANLEKANGLSGAGRSQGSPKIELGGLSEAQGSYLSLAGFFAGADVKVDDVRVPRYRSIREAYVDMTGDEDFTGRVEGLRRTGRLGLSEADGSRVKVRRFELVESEDGKFEYELSEAIASTTFAQILNDSITRKMVKDYGEMQLRTWEPLVDIVPVKDFRTNRRTRMGGYGNLPAVAENGSYDPLSSPGDEEATYAITKRGGTETITLEAIANDDVGAIRRIPTLLARAAVQTLHEFVFDFLRTNPTIYDSVALFHGSHGNLGSTALSSSSLAASRIRTRKQADMSNSKRLGLVPKHLWVPMELEETAYVLTNTDKKTGTADNDENYVKSWGMDYTVVDYWTDANNWFTSADKAQVPIIEIGFFGSEVPEMFLQDMPNVGEMFTNDRLVHKLRHIYGAAVLDYRGLDGSVVA